MELKVEVLDHLERLIVQRPGLAASRRIPPHLMNEPVPVPRLWPLTWPNLFVPTRVIYGVWLLIDKSPIQLHSHDLDRPSSSATTASCSLPPRLSHHQLFLRNTISIICNFNFGFSPVLWGLKGFALGIKVPWSVSKFPQVPSITGYLSAVSQATLRNRCYSTLDI